MKILLVKNGNGDYGATQFQEAHNGVPVIDIINKPEAFLDPEEDDPEDGAWRLEVIEVGEVSKEFITFVRDEIQDHDGKKHTEFYLEDETVKW